ncbi:MAG TPA: hypothetical protein VJS69_10525 [Candidatus Krumholzibacteria bacterium]|nr:hypothetical protein [Candidatus Krumholzibacteria bacterium]
MKRLVSPLLIVLLLSSFVVGWRTTPDLTPPDNRIFMWSVSMTLAGNRLLVSDVDTGLHIFDVSNLSAPTKVMRIPLQNNMSSAVKDDIIYANSGNQLQAIRVSGDSYTVVARIGSVYPAWEGVPSYGNESGMGCSACSQNDAVTAPTAAPGGTGSSYATFAVVDNYLYRADSHDRLVTYDVSSPAKPKQIAQTLIGWGVESMYPTPNYLFIGGMAGMYIFDRAQPAKPVQIAKIEHTRACDPVTVSGSTAFVTLRGSGFCGGVDDELMCVSIKDPHAPEIIGTTPIPTPFGLAVQNQKLYVSNGDGGYSLLDVSDPAAPAVMQTWTGGATRDFIWSDHTLFVLSRDNVYIYDVTNPMAPMLLSQLQGIPAM